MRILAVDDDVIALELLKATLKAAGHDDVTTSTSGQVALNLIATASRPYDCFLLDIQMPEMDGVELCRQIRAAQEYRTAPVIMITAMSERSFIDAAFAAGAIDYVNKPFDSLELGVRIGMAEKLVYEKKISTKNIFAANSLKAKVEDVFKFALEDAVTINDVPQVIGKLAMENYLLQLSRGKVFKSTAVAFAIAEFESIFSRSTPTEMFDTLTDIAEAIESSLKQSNHLITYCGYGEFICVAGRTDPIFYEDLELEIQWAIERMELVYGSGRQCDVALLVGEPYTPSFWSAGHPLDLMNYALASVEDRKRSRRKSSSGKKALPLWQRLVRAG